MKALRTFVLLTALLPGTSALAHSPAASPLTGRWTVDVSRLAMAPAARPKSVTITFSDPGQGSWQTQVDIVDAGGGKSHVVGIATLDGKAAKVEGSAEADAVALKMPEPGVLVMALSRSGVPASTRIYTVDVGGKTMTETVTYLGSDGLPFMRTNYFARAD
ncbi:hypothetical protein RKE25_20535 [Dyella sp. BiH032]|uniref:hypothetical protein n=1 Tax=Dyella sp. BiH032 TaxID=3075430 RepID=UPI0028934881|nr:hypothetical protein [Dyella sp. BiH032]WNL45769.1 hypothetical protein RKE25_20535 [Dyella sp. BiH032]